jgi:hypothetical protein
MVLQSSALSSFHTPAETLRHQVWTDRYNLDDQKDRTTAGCSVVSGWRCNGMRVAPAPG